MFLLLSTLGFAATSGTVFRDLPVNGTTLNTYGVKDTNELGIEGVTVTAYPGGATTATAADGTWSLATTGDARIEFSAWPSYLKESVSSTVNNSSVRFVTNGSTTDFALHNPADYGNTTDPKLVTTKFSSGDPLGGGTSGAFDSVFLFNNSDQGQTYDPATFDVLAKNVDTGAVWGTATQKSSQKIFISAVLRRHSGFGVGGTGGIYVSDVSGAAPYSSSLWLDIDTLAGVDTGTDPRTGGYDNSLYAAAADPSVDLDAFNLVGKMSIGDIAVSEDDTKLYVMNLFQRELLVIDIATKALIEKIAIPDPGCSNGDFRPWGIEEHDGELYVGVTCSAETSQNDADLAIHVMKRTGDTFTTVFSETNMNYARMEISGSGELESSFSAWRTNWNKLSNKGAWPTGDPAPSLSNIKFDKTGAMILAVNDITGLQIGANNYEALSGSASTSTEGISAGDLLRACPNGSAGWTMESNGICGGVTGAESGNGFGTGGGEFYHDYGTGNEGTHQENLWGGLALYPGSDRIIYSSLDPDTAARAGGITWLNNSDGGNNKGYEIYPDAGYTGAEFSKSSGMGEVELLSTPAPVEIGNRVWLDIDADGVQDANEAGSAGVTI